MIKSLDFYLENSSIIIYLIVVLVEILLLTFIVCLVMFCNIFPGNSSELFDCTILKKYSLGYFFFAILIIALSIFRLLKTLKTRQQLLINPTPAISIRNNYISLPIILENNIYYSDIKNIEYLEGLIYTKIVIETIQPNSLILKPNLAEKCHLKTNTKLIWLPSSIDEGDHNLKLAFAQIMKNISK